MAKAELLIPPTCPRTDFVDCPYRLIQEEPDQILKEHQLGHERPVCMSWVCQKKIELLAAELIRELEGIRHIIARK